MVDHISWQLDDVTGAALDDTVLDASPPVLADWDSVFGLSITGFDSPAQNYSFFIRAHVTSR